MKNHPQKCAREFKIFHRNDSKEYKIMKDCIFCLQLRKNRKITNMYTLYMYQKARRDLESSTRSNENSPNTPEKSQLKKWLGIAGVIALLIVTVTAIGYIFEHYFYYFKTNHKTSHPNFYQWFPLFSFSIFSVLFWSGCE